MPERKRSFVNVDELMPQVSLEQVAQFYGITLPELKRAGDEVRLRCFLACGRTDETGDRAIAIRADSPTKTWHCHNYGCGKGGNLLGLMDLMKPGTSAGGRPRGERFKELASDLASIVSGGVANESNPASPQTQSQRTASEPSRNSLLAESDNPRARELLTLDEQFITDVAAMPPEASSYFRRRPFLTPGVCRQWRMGYLPQSAKSLLRGKIVYGYQDDDGQLLTWFGRDPRYESKLAEWKASDRSEPEPIKTQFVKGFHRGLELYGAHAISRITIDKESAGSGLFVVEGPNDAIRLQSLGVPAVALCSNTITREQAQKAAGLARECAGGIITLLLDCDEEGERGVQQALPMLAEYAPVRLGWSARMHGGGFRGRQPESIDAEEWKRLVLGLAI